MICYQYIPQVLGNKIIPTIIVLICFGATVSLANESKMAHTADEKPFLGVAYQVTDTNMFTQKTAGFGYKILRVLKDTAADVAGLQAGDIIIAFDAQDLTSLKKKKRHKFFSEYIKSKRVSDIFSIIILRKETMITAATQKIDSIEDLKTKIDNQGIEEKLHVSIDNQVKQLHLSAVLGVRATVDEKDVLSNSVLFPTYEQLNTTHTRLAKQVISDLDLDNAYADLLKRYEKNQLWDKGFRLKLFRYLHRDPLKLTPVIDAQLTALASKAHTPSDTFIHAIGSWIDISTTPISITHPSSTKKQPHLDFIVKTINQAEALRKKAFAKLSAEEMAYLKEQLPPLMERFSHSFYIDRPKHKQDQTHNLKVIQLTKKVDFSALLGGGALMMSLHDSYWLEALAIIIRKDNENTLLESHAGKILLGGFGDNHYTKAYALIIDIEGNDTYTGASGIASDGISAIIDFVGDDEYQHTRAYAQGSAFLGIGTLYDMSGNDIYTADTYAQAFSLLGVATLIDLSGDDQYFSNKFSQAAAFWGVAALLDMQGNDNYQANLYAQGLGGVKGFAALIDDKGDDFYFATGSDESSYGVSGIFKSAAQGAGIGFRGYASGGIGLILDGNGKDRFRAGNFSQGIGYFLWFRDY